MKKKSRLMAAVLAMVMVFTMLIVPNLEPANADSMKEINYKTSVTISTGFPVVWVNLGKRWNENKSLKVVSSNKKVVAVESGYPVLEVKKPGTATVKFKTAGKTYAMKVKVVKYKNPVKAFKVGGKSVAGKFKKYTMGDVKFTKAKAKVVVKPNSGWVLKKIKYKAYKYNYKTDKFTSYTKTVKNKGTFKFKSGDDWDHYVIVTLYNKSSKVTENLELFVDRGTSEEY